MIKDSHALGSRYEWKVKYCRLGMDTPKHSNICDQDEVTMGSTQMNMMHERCNVWGAIHLPYLENQDYIFLDLR